MSERPLWAAWFARMLIGFGLFQSLYSADVGRAWGARFAAVTEMPFWATYTLLLLMPLAGVVSLFLVFDALAASRSSSRLTEVSALYGLASVPLALLGHLGAKAREALGEAPFTMILFDRHFLSGDLVRVLQWVAIVAGLLFSLFLVLRLSGAARSRRVDGKWGISALQASPLCLLALTLWLLMGLA